MCPPYVIVQSSSAYLKSVFQIHGRRAAGKDIPLFTRIFVVDCVCLCPTEKRYKPEIWCIHSPRPYLKNAYLFFFQRNKIMWALKKILDMVKGGGGVSFFVWPGGGYTRVYTPFFKERLKAWPKNALG